MGYKTNDIKNIRTIKAWRGEVLLIDLGSEQNDTVRAWMKKDPNSPTYRSFEIVDNRYLKLTAAKASDYLDIEGNVTEAIEGKWYFDVEQSTDFADPDLTKTVFRGTILFQNDITGSNGVEILDPVLTATFASLADTPDDYIGQALKVVRVKSTEDGLEFAVGGVGGSSDFVSLTDTPNDYAGQAGKATVVNSTEDGLEFTDLDFMNTDGLNSMLDLLNFRTDQTTPSYSEGRVFYDNSKKALSYFNNKSDITVNLGQEVLFSIENQTGELLPNGTIISPDTATIISKADAKNKDKSRIIAVLTQDVPDGETGYATKLGQVGGLDTSPYAPGTILYLSATTPGAFTNVRPNDGAYSVIVGVVDVQDVTNGIITVDTRSTDTTVEVTDTNGFPTDMREGTELSTTTETRTFSISPKAPATDFHFYELGDKFEVTGEGSIVWTDAEGEHWFYYEEGVLIAEYEPNLDRKIHIILNRAFISAIYWDATNKEIVGDMQDERHGISMSPATHLNLHLTRGAQWVYGYSLGDFDIDGDGDLASAAQFSVSAGEFLDEDLDHKELGLPVGSTIPIIYNEGADGYTRQVEQTGFAINGVSGVGVYYNEWTGTTWQKTIVPNRDACCYHLFSFNGVDKKTVSVMGQVAYASVRAARNGAATEISNIVSRLPFAEMIPVGTIVVESRTTYDNAVGGRIRSIDGDNYISWTTTELSQGASPTSHANLTNVNVANIDISRGHIDNSFPLVFPTLSTVERNLIVTPNTSMKIYNSDDQEFQYYNGIEWVSEISAINTYRLFQPDETNPFVYTDNSAVLTVDGRFQTTGQAHGGSSIEVFSAAKTFDLNNGGNQYMPVSANTTLSLTNKRPGTYVVQLQNTAIVTSIVLDSSFGDSVDNNPLLLLNSGDRNKITIHVDANNVTEYIITTKTA